jgi:hypothetical protein
LLEEGDMHAMLRARDRFDDHVHWSRRDTPPLAAVLAWAGGIVVTAAFLFGVGMVGR